MPVKPVTKPALCSHLLKEGLLESGVDEGAVEGPAPAVDVAMVEEKFARAHSRDATSLESTFLQKTTTDFLSLWQRLDKWISIGYK